MPLGSIRDLRRTIAPGGYFHWSPSATGPGGVAWSADEGGGWLQFKSLHPITKLPADKMAYVLPAGKDWVVMCSINKTDGRD